MAESQEKRDARRRAHEPDAHEAIRKVQQGEDPQEAKAESRGD